MVDLVQAASIIIPLIVVAWIGGRSLHIVRPTQRGLVERNRRYHHFVNTGLTFLFPVIDRLIKVNVTEQITEPEPQVIITKDRLNLSINMVVSYKVRPDEASVKNSEYSVNNYRQQIDILGHVALRDILGSMVYEEANPGERRHQSTAADQAQDPNGLLGHRHRQGGNQGHQTTAKHSGFDEQNYRGGKHQEICGKSGRCVGSPS